MAHRGGTRITSYNVCYTKLLRLKTLVEKHKVDIRTYPGDVLATLRKYSAEVVEELAAKDDFARRVYDSYMDVLKGSRQRNNFV